jgi:hypothetical protein
MMNCSRVQDLLCEFLEGTLAEGERAAVEAHMGRCPACTAEAAAAREISILLRTLPVRPAPPELLERVMARTPRDEGAAAPTSLLRRLFLPAHVKIPLEAAAAVLLFLLVHGFPGEAPRTPPPAPPAPLARTAPPAAPRDGVAESGGAAEADIGRTAPPRAQRAARSARAIPGWKRRVREEAKPEGPEDRPLPAEPARAERDFPPPESPAALPAPPGLPPASYISTAARPVRLQFTPREEPRGFMTAGAGLPRVMAAPPSRLLKPVPHGRDVILEMPAGTDENVEERILAAAARAGGGRSADLSRRDVAEEPGPENRFVRVRVPAGRASGFLDELREIGRIPPWGEPPDADFPAGPSADVVSYTVRIRVR